jgi:hypothetical protein
VTFRVAQLLPSTRQVYLKKGALYFLSSKKEALEKLQDVGMVQGWGVEFLTYVSDCIYRLMIKHGNGKSSIL